MDDDCFDELISINSNLRDIHSVLAEIRNILTGDRCEEEEEDSPLPEYIIEMYDRILLGKQSRTVRSKRY